MLVISASFTHRSQVSELLLVSHSDIASIALSERLFVATLRSCSLGITVAIRGMNRVLGALIASVCFQCAFEIDRRAFDRASPNATFSWRQTVLLVPGVLSKRVFTGVLCCLAPCHVSCR